MHLINADILTLQTDYRFMTGSKMREILLKEVAS